MARKFLLKNIKKMIQGKYLVTTDEWFYAPDGVKYKAVWGDVRIIEDTSIGVKTNRNSTNWYAFIGSEDKGVLVAGCQIHYAVKCNNKPNTKSIDEVIFDDGEYKKSKRTTEIYIAE
ncbi:MAG: hypothetical protein ACTHY0_02265 [Mammaliicoccus vitulinus]